MTSHKPQPRTLARALLALTPLLAPACSSPDLPVGCTNDTNCTETSTTATGSGGSSSTATGGTLSTTSATCGDAVCSGTESPATCCVDCGCQPEYLCIGGQCTLSAEHIWSRSFGGIGEQRAYFSTVAWPSNGIALVAANGDNGIVDFGGGPFSSTGSYDIVLARFSSDGTHLWSKQLGDGAYQVPSALVARDNMLALAAVFSGTIDFGSVSYSAPSGPDALVTILDGFGSPIWGRVLDNVSVYAIGLDSTGHSIVAGHVSGVTDLGAGATTAPDGLDAFVAKYDASGNHVWSKIFAGADDQFVQSLAVDSSDNIYVAGRFAEAFTVNGSTLSSPTGHGLFVIKLTAQGEAQWNAVLPGDEVEYADALTIDKSGSVLLAGSFAGILNVGDQALISAGSFDAVLAKFDPSGTPLWSRRFGDADDQESASVIVDGDGNIVFTGQFAGSIDFGNGPLSNLLFAKLSSDGDYVSSRQAPNVIQRHSSVDNQGNIIFLGDMYASSDLGGGALPYGGYTDIVLAKYSK